MKSILPDNALLVIVCFFAAVVGGVVAGLLLSLGGICP